MKTYQSYKLFVFYANAYFSGLTLVKYDYLAGNSIPCPDSPVFVGTACSFTPGPMV